MYRVLRAVSGPLEGEEYLIDGVLQIGRAGDIAVQLIGPTVSRRHAEVRIEADGNTVLSDLNSRNGTFMNGEQVERVVLSSGDSFEVGNSSFVFEERPGDAPQSDDLQLNLLSGPVEDETAIFNRHQLGLPLSRRPTTVPQSMAREEGCTDPLHEVARAKGWKYCPSCGETTRGDTAPVPHLPSDGGVPRE